jgi:hypothetical protein
MNKRLLTSLGILLAALLLFEGSFHTHGNENSWSDASGDHCFLCSFLGGAEAPFIDPTGEIDSPAGGSDDVHPPARTEMLTGVSLPSSIRAPPLSLPTT